MVQIKDLNGNVIFKSYAKSASSADFQFADLRNADFRNIDAGYALFGDAIIEGADFSGANLCGTRLSEEYLSEHGAKYYEKTIFGTFPTEVYRRPCWM